MTSYLKTHKSLNKIHNSFSHGNGGVGKDESQPLEHRQLLRQEKFLKFIIP